MDLSAYQSGAVATAPAVPSTPSFGKPTAGLPGVTPATVPGPYWFYQQQKEMEAILLAAGLTPDQTNLSQLLTALNTLYSSSSVGEVKLTLGTIALPNTLKLNGALISRVSYPKLTTYVLSCGNVVSDAEWLAGKRGAYSLGDGSTTIRLPNVRGVFPRFFHDGDSTDPDYLTRLMGILQASQNLAHVHDIYTNGEGGSGGQTGNVRDSFNGVGGSHGQGTWSSGGSEARPVNLPFLGLVRYQ